MPVYQARSKINLRLVVLAREASGYHQIETLFCALELSDTLEIERGGRTIDLTVDGLDAGPVHENLVHRAASAFLGASGARSGVRISLHKRIPAGTGLGGGSSDAAATLLALNALYGQPLASPALLELGGRLGSDVPFFLSRAPLALAWGRGDRLLVLQPPPVRPVLLVVPAERVSTAEAYGWLARTREHAEAVPPSLLRAENLRDWAAAANAAVNDFEGVVFERVTRLRTLRDALRAAGARPAMLTGSGSALFGIFADEESAAAARRTLREAHADVTILATRTAAM